jgi:acylphosphatase
MTDSSSSPTTARLVHFAGQVQGVGFRFTAARLAADHAVSGWVRNLPDGRVQLLVEGPEPAVEGFLQDVRERWQGYIEQEESERRQSTGRLTSFEVKH